MNATAAQKDASDNSGENIAFNAEISKVLKLMIHSLYTNKDIFLRELISNASDACDKLRYLSVTDDALLGDQAELKVTITSNRETNTLQIIDTGIGMNRDDLIENLGTIARSGTQSFVEQLSGNDKKDSALIGQFGVGFYSSFMVADTVEVTSKKAGEDAAWKWESDGEGSFTISEAPADTPRGTSITLYLKDDAKEYADSFRARHIVESYSDHISFPIYQISDEEGADGPTIINEGSALWTRPQQDITPEQYKEFYHHVGHSADEPFMTLHNKAEGVVEYTNLLFIPSMKPFDLFHPERRRRVKLYVKRVFITDENLEIIPHNLRFLRGIVDSQDLPLNISRETLQDNPILQKIRQSITSKVLTELQKKAKKDKEAYAKFWEDFGSVLKEGLCEAQPQKDQEKLINTCRFRSSMSDDLISLEDYTSRMKDDQKEIFYLTGENLDSLKNSPQLEGFVKRDVEVLLLTDHVDDFWINVVRTFQDKEFKSITRADIDLDEVTGKKSSDDAEKSDDNDDDNSAQNKDKIDNLITLLKASYSDEIKDVRTTSKLSSTPVCLAVDEGSMDFRMERFLMDHKQLPKRAAKILEINPTHPLITLLADQANSNGASDEMTDAALLLLEQAKIIEGEPIEDAVGFAKRLSHFMTKAIAA